MSSITQLKRSPGSIKFKINNKKDAQYEVALVNGLRRAIIAHLEVYCFSRESINFTANTSIYTEDFISMRVNLVPLNFVKIDKLNIEELEGYFDMINDDPVDVQRCYARDIKIYSGPFDSSIESRKIIEDLYPLPDILLFELKPGQRLKFSVRIVIGTHKVNGSSFCATSKCLYYFEEDSKEIQKKLSEIPSEKHKDFELLDGQRHYLKTSSGIPEVFNFEIENDGVMPIETYFPKGCDILLNILKNNIEQIKNIETSTQVAIETSPTNMVGFDFVFEKSDDTLGNIIQSYGMREKDIHYIGYHIPHPLDKRLYIRLSLVDEKATRQDYEKKIIFILQKVISVLDGLKKDYSAAV